MLGPGNYTFSDFVKIGVPFTGDCDGGVRGDDPDAVPVLTAAVNAGWLNAYGYPACRPDKALAAIWQNVYNG